jgi:hypothetical protein
MGRNVHRKGSSRRVKSLLFKNYFLKKQAELSDNAIVRITVRTSRRLTARLGFAVKGSAMSLGCFNTKGDSQYE